MLFDVEAVWIALVIIALVGMWWAGFKMEPHWVSKDGTRFLCTAQELDGVNTVDHPKETRVLIAPDGALYVTQKRMMRRRSSMWTLVAKAPQPQRNIQVYVAEHREPDNPITSRLAIRIPTKSRCIALLDDILAQGTTTTSLHGPQSAATANLPEQD